MPTTITQPRWLSSEQQVIWRAWLDGAARINEHLDAALRPFGLDLAEYEVLVRLSESADRQLRMSDLAAQARQSRSRLTHTITRMERKGIVARVACPADGRGVMAMLTPSGFRLLEQAAPYHVESVREVLVDPVEPQDYEALGRAMKAVLGVSL